MMRNSKIAWFIALTVTAGCSNVDSDKENSLEGEDFRDGSYHYVLGYDPVTGEQIRGGAHAIVTFDDDGKREPISSSNFPSRFHPDLRDTTDYYVFDSERRSGSTDWDVFPSTWWPQSKNGTAWRWQPGATQDYNDHSDVDRLSPMEKYDMMFYPGQEQTVDAVSHCEYQDYVDDPDNCDKIDHPELSVTGPATRWEIENQGNYQWVEPENWWGHCNGWASYATTEEMGYPLRDITVKFEGNKVVECTESTEGCIKWRMADVEALFTELYFSDQATFSGRRCNTRPDDIERDEFGRPTDPACRDINPAAFHIAIVGMFNRGARDIASGAEDAKPAFVIDHNYDHEVWNFPLVEYNVNETEEVTESEANDLVGANGSDYEFNSSAAKFVRVSLTYFMISDSVPANELLVRADQRDLPPVPVELNYVLELDANDRIMGGEWIVDPSFSWRDSKELHPDFMWKALEAPGFGENSDDLGGNNDNPYIALSKARMLLACANDPDTCAPSGGGGGGGDLIVDDLSAVQRGESREYDTGVVSAGRYTITLAHDPANPGGDADLYVRVGSRPTTSTFDCRPYLNGSVEECIVDLASEDSIFISVIGYSVGSNAYRLTVEGDGGGGGGGGEEWDGLNESGTIGRNQEARFSTPTLDPGTYVFELSGTGDADLYTLRGSAPSTSNWECRPYLSGSDETCSVTLSSAGVIHVMVRGYAQSSTWELVGRPQ